MNWDDLPDYLKNSDVEKYYQNIKKKKIQLLIKRLFDIVFSSILLILLSPVFLYVSIKIKLDSEGPVFFKQKRVTLHGKEFEIFKFRTMKVETNNFGSSITLANDSRITKFGLKIREKRIDEIPQLINILIGDMSFVGTRPEVPKYVRTYTNEMYATLLLRAGVTSTASICYKDESELIGSSINPDKVYEEIILPEKMKYNLNDIKEFSLLGDIKILINTVIAVVK